MAVTNLHSYQQCARILISPHSNQSLLPVIGHISHSNWGEVINIYFPGYYQC